MGAAREQNSDALNNVTEVEIINETPELSNEEDIVEFVNGELRDEYEIKFYQFKEMLTLLQTMLNANEEGAGNAPCFANVLAQVTIVIDNTLTYREQNVLLGKKIDLMDSIKWRLLDQCRT